MSKKVTMVVDYLGLRIGKVQTLDSGLAQSLLDRGWAVPVPNTAPDNAQADDSPDRPRRKRRRRKAV